MGKGISHNIGRWGGDVSGHDIGSGGGGSVHTPRHRFPAFSSLKEGCRKPVLGVRGQF